ncbi:MAG: nickel-dependent lactate racemase [Deltaproteobacteria bacterium]|nr:nickel-dependent lactate racemase [Deltaproteobacteria bacterium]
MSMREFTVRYGKETRAFALPEERISEVLEARSLPVIEDVPGEIRRSLENPIDSPPLREVVKSGQTVAVVVQDISRMTRSDVFLPVLLDELNGAGVPDENIIIVFANGNHRRQTPEEQRYIVGEKVAQRVRMVDNDSSNLENMSYYGRTSRGTEVYINRLVADADRIILTGGIVYHLAAGYGGGRKCLLPGVSHDITINHNHAYFLHPDARSGMLEGNPCHEDIMEAAKMADPHFLLNVVLDSRQEFVAVLAGNWITAHRKGCDVVDQLYKINIDRQFDLAIASCGGYPRDHSLRQAQKGQDHALKSIRQGGVLIYYAECIDGPHDKPGFMEFMNRYQSADEMGAVLRKKFDIGGVKAYWLKEAAQYAETILISSMDDDLVKKCACTPAHSFQEAMDLAMDRLGNDPSICIIPDAGVVLPFLEKQEAAAKSA